jgi:four helix bundle protein
MFSHERLIVYQESLHFASHATTLTEQWDRKHAITDHLSRAAESIVLNLAEACRADSIKVRHSAMDYSLGSLFECAACLDVASVKALLDIETTLNGKKQLLAMCGKLIGLRKSWDARCVREDSTEYNVGPPRANTRFSHETLDVYRVALDVIRLLFTSVLWETNDTRVLRDVDETATSMVLNIAEGNGRFAELDHQRFLGIANRSAIRLAVLLDLGAARGTWASENLLDVKTSIERVANMTGVMAKK